MKKVTLFAVSVFTACALAVPARAGNETMTDSVQNVKVGSRNTAAGWVEVLDNTHAEASKGKNAPEQITGVVAGGAIGVRRTLHRAGAGVIDLLTFWIPKKQPLINPEKARLQ